MAVSGHDATFASWFRVHSSPASPATIERMMDLFLGTMLPAFRRFSATHTGDDALRLAIAGLSKRFVGEADITQEGLHLILEVYHERGGIRFRRTVFRQKVEKLLTGSYSPEGIERWWHRARIALSGKTPAEILAREPFDPADELSRRVLRLARELAGPGNTA